MIDWAVHLLAKWWRNAVDQFKLQSQGKKLGQKRFSQILFFDCEQFFCKKKVTNIQIVTHPYLAQMSKTCLKFFTTILPFWHSAISEFCFFLFGTKKQLISSGAIWANGGEKWLMGRLTILPNYEEMLLTDLSSKLRKNF